MSIYYEPGTEGLADPNHHLNAALEAVAEVARKLKQERDEAREALQRIADCDWVISLPDRMDAVRKIARDALEGTK